MTRSSALLALFAALGFIAGPLLLGGCGSGSSYRVNTADIADRYLPTTRDVSYHPDSLRAVSIEEKEEQFQVELESSYEALHRQWSSTYQSIGAGRSRRTLSYATFWSRELSLAALEAEVGFSTLSKDQAQKFLREREQEYQNALQFDVYWFESDGNSLLAGPGARVVLEIDDEEYRPTRESHGPLRDAFLSGDNRRAIYRRNTFYFARIPDSTDVLANANRMRLTINRAGTGSRARFAWEWGTE
jgi:hypothetical protein